MKRYIPPTSYAVDIEPNCVANWGSMEFDKNGTSSFDEKPNGMDLGGGSNYFDSASSRSSWKEYNSK